MRKFATALFVGACVFGLAACGGGGGSDKVQVGKDGKKVTISGGKSGADISVGGGELPDGFPKSDVPLPSTNTKDIVRSSSSSVGGKQRWSISYNASGKNAAKDYVSKLKDAGFTEQGSSSAGGSSARSSFSAFLSKGKYEVNAIGFSASGANTLAIVVSPNYSSPDTSTT